MKKILALALTIMMISTPVLAAPTTDGECKDLYPLTGIVTEVHEVDKDTDLVTMTCANGNQFSWYADAEDCWSINDLASCIMNSNGTEIVYDDEIVDAHYAGGLKQFAQYARED
jgi:hypothetical protein